MSDPVDALLPGMILPFSLAIVEKYGVLPVRRRNFTPPDAGQGTEQFCAVVPVVPPPRLAGVSVLATAFCKTSDVGGFIWWPGARPPRFRPRLHAETLAPCFPIRGTGGGQIWGDGGERISERMDRGWTNSGARAGLLAPGLAILAV